MILQPPNRESLLFHINTLKMNRDVLRNNMKHLQPESMAELHNQSLINLIEEEINYYTKQLEIPQNQTVKSLGILGFL